MAEKIKIEINGKEYVVDLGVGFTKQKRKGIKYKDYLKIAPELKDDKKVGLVLKKVLELTRALQEVDRDIQTVLKTYAEGLLEKQKTLTDEQKKAILELVKNMRDARMRVVEGQMSIGKLGDVIIYYADKLKNLPESKVKEYIRKVGTPDVISIVEQYEKIISDYRERMSKEQGVLTRELGAVYPGKMLPNIEGVEYENAFEELDEAFGKIMSFIKKAWSVAKRIAKFVINFAKLNKKTEQVAVRLNKQLSKTLKLAPVKIK